jgi:hypothetical protein
MKHSENFISWLMNHCDDCNTLNNNAKNRIFKYVRDRNNTKPAIFLSASNTSRELVLSRPDVGSSKNNTVGSATSSYY